MSTKPLTTEQLYTASYRRLGKVRDDLNKVIDAAHKRLVSNQPITEREFMSFSNGVEHLEDAIAMMMELLTE